MKEDRDRTEEGECEWKQAASRAGKPTGQNTEMSNEKSRHRTAA